MNNKLTCTLLLVLLATAFSHAQSLKLNRIFVSYKIPKKIELTGYKTYEVKLLTNALVLTQSEVEGAKLDDNAIGVDVSNARKKGQLAQQYLAHMPKGFTLVDETKDPEIIFLLETNDLSFTDVNPNWVQAQPTDVVARFDGSALLKALDAKAGSSLWEKKFEVPAEQTTLTREDLFTLAPGVNLQLKFTKKTEEDKIDALLATAFNDARLHFITYLLRNAGAAVAAAYEDQKSGFNIPVFAVKGKADYSELDQAAKAIMTAAEALPDDQSIAAIKASPLHAALTNAIAVWHKEIATQSDADGARITSDIARGLNLNLAFAYMFLGESDRAKSALLKTDFLVPEGAELSNTGSAKEYYINIERAFTEISPAGEQVLFTIK